VHVAGTGQTENLLKIVVGNPEGKKEIRRSRFEFNPLALELDIYSSAHHSCKT
jgi:hypothetical protein